jgi:hypothetical protein
MAELESFIFRMLVQMYEPETAFQWDLLNSLKSVTAADDWEVQLAIDTVAQASRELERLQNDLDPLTAHAREVFQAGIEAQDYLVRF